MTDEHLPHENFAGNAPSGDASPDLPEETFEGLDLGVLADGARPSSRQWDVIATEAARRRHRRTWLVASAALVVLVVGVAAVLLTREGDRDTVDIATGGLAADAYILPPKGAKVLSIEEANGAYGFTYEHDGAFYSLATTNAGGPTSLPSEEVLAHTYPTPIDPFGTVYLACATYNAAVPLEETVGTAIDGSDVSGATIVPDRPVSFGGPVTANWLLPTLYVTLRPMAGDDEPCTPPTEPDAELVAAVGDLRVGSREEWTALLRQAISDEASDVPATTAPSVPTTFLSPATTLPEEPPADRASAEEQIAAAVAGFDDEAPDGSFPNLEDGVAKAAEYREAFDLARRQSGAAQIGDGQGGGDTSALGDLRFVTPERANITITFTSTLPSGTFTFGQGGEAILQDGRWVVTYRTVITTLGRACVPPGGYDGCPDRGAGAVQVVPGR